MPESEQFSGVPLLSACLAAPAGQVAEVLTFCRTEDVRLLDAPTADVLDVVAELAVAGTPPTLDVVNAELLRRGTYAGHTGDLVKDRMLRASSPQHLPELLPKLAAAALAAVFRARLAAAGQALANGAESASEPDLWELLTREGTRARDLRDRLAQLRGEVTA